VKVGEVFENDFARERVSLFVDEKLGFWEEERSRDNRH
jgi:hypothetical protein